MNKRAPYTNPRLIYARSLRWVTVLGFLIITAGFVIYVSGLLPSTVSADKIAQNWHMSSHEFIAKLDIPTGWDWVHYLSYGDIISFASIALLAAGTLLSLLAVGVAFCRQGNRIYAVIVALQILVLVFAASGLAGTGH
jgi:uncharacterized membrane protein